ncbi:MAG TPA: CPBP family intramembrane glutamic endopeptidase [Daejeonella sp.]|nr:CPBP family intramembrane glutamic endopeptidase [Daejeonella sp.]
MENFIQEIVSSISQLLILVLIPFLFYLFKRKQYASFSQYIGFTKPNAQSVQYALLIAVLFSTLGIGLFFLNDGLREALLTPQSVSGKLRLSGFSTATILSLLLIAWVKTSLSEEIFFRGFIGKRLINLLGFAWGNLSQALLFGLLHFVLFMQLTELPYMALLVILLSTTIIGWLVGFVKDRVGNGSIVPGWIAHGIGNTLSYALVAFVL